MGILNITPDSFSDGGKFLNKDKAIIHATKLIESGAHIIDVGGESSRPGSSPILVSEELDRVIPVIYSLREKFSEILLSIDTNKAEVAKKALIAGADIINDISAMNGDLEMPEVIYENKVPIILMHMRGTPKNMQINIKYNNIIEEVITYFKKQIEFAKSFNILDEQIILDPGIGFGKTTEQNFMLLNNINLFCELGYPILVGTSRKSFIKNTLKSNTDDLLEGSIASSLYSIFKGARIIRVHDVREVKRAVLITEKAMNAG